MNGSNFYAMMVHQPGRILHQGLLPKRDQPQLILLTRQVRLLNVVFCGTIIQALPKMHNTIILL